MTATSKKKHVVRELYEDFSLPQEHQSIVKILKSCGNNLHQVTTVDGDVFLVSMPSKFRKHVWIKRGDYVLTEPIPEGNKVRAEIVRILMKDHIRHIVANNLWPAAFMGEEEENKYKLNKVTQEVDSSKDSDDSDSELMRNPNRPILPSDPESDSDSESSDCDDSDSDGEHSEASDHDSENSEASDCEGSGT